MNQTPDLERLAVLLCVEMHMDIPGLAEAVEVAVRKAYERPGPGPGLKQAIADLIEDELDHTGQRISRYLDEAAEADWRGIVGRAFDKAMRRV